ncbi:MAG TPA: tRNA (adenosine(37)-N6)-threonylcarbamoyltransferase complex transferase subunit TsaD [Thermoanaerobaculia bacterium]|nr:tRNA (adenosine(37)-N6)-threonylcarbamoyltransferase complex transferase subunit TsaD [Thermoanaerobaculia bacterium]
MGGTGAGARARSPLVLGVETSCDDTACAVVDGVGRVLTSVVSSQIAAHRPYGGVVPEIASREHLSNWPTVYERTLREARVGIDEIDAVAATSGPGLVGSLLVGLSLGKALAYARRVPFFAMHHLEGHLYSPFLVPGADAEPVPGRFVGLVVSGGHTALYAVRAGEAQEAQEAQEAEVETLGETRDDAMGEAFDKVGKRLGLPFPAGPRVDALAESAEAGWADEFPFRVPRCAAPLDFSYSGLKTRAVQWIEKLEAEGVATDLVAEPHPRALGLLAAFRAAAVAQVLERVERCHRSRRFDCLAVSGGVAANRLLRQELEGWAARRCVDLRLVPIAYSGDNAAMIAFAALRRLTRGESGDDPRAVEAMSRVALGPRAPSSAGARPAVTSAPAAPR